MPPLLWCLILIAACALGMLVGGAGGNRAWRRRIVELEADVCALTERLTTEQKRRAGKTLQDSKRSNIEEAAMIAAASKLQKPEPVKLPGRANGTIQIL